VTSRGKKPPADIANTAEEHMASIGATKIPAERITTVGEFVTGVYFPWVDKHMRPSTAKGYKGYWKDHLQPLCANAWMKNVRTFHIQGWLNEIGGKGLSRNSLKRIKSSLSAIFKLAKQLDYFDGENPARDTAVNPAAPAPVETYAYSLEEVNSILTYLPEPAATAFAIAAYTGLRVGEIEALRWEDYRGGEIHVSRSIWNGRVSEPKTRKSRAAVPVIQQLADRLEMHRMRSRGAQSGAIFQTSKGTHYSMHNLERRTILPALNRCKQCMKPEDKHDSSDHRYVRDARLPEWHGWHACRRGLGSNLNHIGVDDSVIQRILRHANISTTQTYYIKTMGNDVKDAMAKLAQADLDTSRTPTEEKLKPM